MSAVLSGCGTYRYHLSRSITGQAGTGTMCWHCSARPDRCITSG